MYTLAEEKVEGQDFKLTKINKRDRMNLMIIELSMNGNPVQKIEFNKDSVLKVIQMRNMVCRILSIGKGFINKKLGKQFNTV